MKNLGLIIIALGLFSQGSAQELETLWSKGGPQVRGAYGAATQKFSSIDGQFATLLGGYGGVLFTSDWLFGAGAYALLNGNSIDIENEAGTSRQMTYVGLVAERAFQSHRAIHFTSHLLAGAAFIGEQNVLPGGGQYSISSRGAFALEPGAGIEINLTKWFRINGGVSYRWLVSEANYSAPTATISLKFGKF